MYAQYPTYLMSLIINLCGQFLDALISIYFLHKFFSPKIPKCQHLWIIAAVFMTAATQIGDYISGNNVNVWQFLLLFIPFLYTVLFEHGSLLIKFLMCGLPYIILLSLETLGVTAMRMVNEVVTMNYILFLIMYIFRRIILKIPLLLIVKFLLNYSIYDSHYELQRHWYLLGSTCFFEYLMLFFIRRYKDSVKEMTLCLVISIFCCLVPILFYCMIYLMETNLKRTQIGISQKNYIDTQEQYMTQLMNMQDSLRKFKHDYKAHLFCMDNLLMDQNYEELHQYLQNIHDMEKKYDHFQMYAKDGRINIILNQIRYLAEKKEVELTMEIKNAQIRNIALYDLNMLLFNLGSNAVDAASKTEEKKVELTMEKNRAYVQIMIQNSVRENPLKENPNFVTTKKNKEIHGFGMQIIRNVAEKYQGMIQIDATDKTMKINVLLMDET